MEKKSLFLDEKFLFQERRRMNGRKDECRHNPGEHSNNCGSFQENQWTFLVLLQQGREGGRERKSDLLIGWAIYNHLHWEEMEVKGLVVRLSQPTHLLCAIHTKNIACLSQLNPHNNPIGHIPRVAQLVGI